MGGGVATHVMRMEEVAAAEEGRDMSIRCVCVCELYRMCVCMYAVLGV